MSIITVFLWGCAHLDPYSSEMPYGDKIWTSSPRDRAYLRELEKPTSSVSSGPVTFLQFGREERHVARSIPVLVLCLSDYIDHKNFLKNPPELKGVRYTQISLSFFDSHKNLLKEEAARTGPDGTLDLFPLLPTMKKTRFVAINSNGILFYFDMIEVIRDQRMFIPCEPFFEKPRSTNP